MPAVRTPLTADSIIAHPLDSETYSCDFEARLPAGVTIESATIRVDRFLRFANPRIWQTDSPGGLAVGEPTVSTDGRSVEFTIAAETAGSIAGGDSYRLTVAATCSDAAIRTAVCPLAIREA